MEKDLDLDMDDDNESTEMEHKLNKAKKKIYWRKRANEILETYQLKLSYGG